MLLHENRLVIVDDDFNDCNDLEELEIVGTHASLSTMDEIATKISLHRQSVNKIRIELSYAKIPELPKEIWRLNGLKILSLSGLTFKSNALLPETIGNLSRLQHLHFYDCPTLQTLPGDVGSLSLLETLNLENCTNLKIINFLLSHGSKLKSTIKVIRISRNMELRQSIKSSFEQIANLAKLFQFLATCPNLEFIDLPSNEIANLDGFLPLVTSEPLTKLRRLDLSENPIIYHPLSSSDAATLSKILQKHPALGYFGAHMEGNTWKGIDKVVDAIILRHWNKYPILDYFQQINRGGRVLLGNVRFISLWPVILGRTNTLFSKYRAKRRIAGSIYYLIRENQDLIHYLSSTTVRVVKSTSDGDNLEQSGTYEV